MGEIFFTEQDPIFYIIFFIIIAVPYIPIFLKNFIIKKYIDYPCNYNGLEVAQRIIETNGLKDVRIKRQEGGKTNRYSTISKTIFLSGDIYDTRSITACALAAHKAALAIQDSKNLKLLRLRERILPVSKDIVFDALIIASYALFLFFGMAALIVGLLVVIAILLMSLSIEIGAIHIAIKNVKENNLLRYEDDISAVKTVLIANLFSIRP